MTEGPVEAWMALSAPVNQSPLRPSEKLPVQSPIRIDALAAQRGSAACGVLEHPREKEPREDICDEASTARTRAALLVLMDRRTEADAMHVLWEENSAAIEREMLCHLATLTHPAAREQLLAAVAADSKYFCEEFDDPKEWVSRCANLEARRLALESSKRYFRLG